MTESGSGREPGVEVAGRIAQVAIHRRSYRGPFLPEVPTPGEIDEILAAGLAAPSSKNARPWRFHLVTDAAMLKAIADDVVASEGIESYVPVDPVSGRPHEQYVSTVAESADALSASSLAIFVENSAVFSVGRAALITAPSNHLADALVGHGFEILGVGGAIQSMWLTASDLGLAGVFIGDVVIAEDLIARRLGIRGDLLGVLALGYPTDPERAWHARSIDLGEVERH